MNKSLSLVRRIIPWLLSALAASLVAAPAEARSKPPAAKAKRRIAVGAFSGPKSADARSSVLDALKSDDDYDVADASDVAADADAKSYAKASRGLRVQALLTGTVKKSSTLVLSVHNGADGALIQDVEIKGGSPAKLNKSIAETLVISVADLIAQGKPAGKASAEDDEDDPPAKAKQAEDDEAPAKSKPRKAKHADAEDDEPSTEAARDAPAASKPRGPGAFEALVGIRVTRRSFTYQDTLAQVYPSGGFPVPLTFLLPLGPAPFLDLTFYPFAIARSGGFMDDVGLIAGGEFSIPLKVVLDQGGATELTTSSHQFYAGLRDRIRSGPHEFGVIAAFGQHAYQLNGDIQPAPAFKDITYTFIKLGADMRLNFGRAFLGGHAGSRLVLSTGGIKKIFPHAKAQSIDVGIMGGYGVSDSLDLQVGIDWLRYGLSFNPVPSDTQENGTPLVAGGAVDQYLSGYAGVRYHF